MLELERVGRDVEHLLQGVALVDQSAYSRVMSTDGRSEPVGRPAAWPVPGMREAR